MKDIKITIVGGAGRMGRWIARTLDRDIDKIYINDKDVDLGRSFAEKEGFRFTSDYSCIPESDIVIISVPIEVTSKVIKEVGPLMKKDSLLIDVTSVKEGPVKAMEKHVPSDVAKIGSHPLFGPEGNSFKDKNVVLVPIDDKGWLDEVKGYIESDGGNVRLMTAEEHDRKMAVVQGASHMLLILFGSILRDQEYETEENKDLSTPTFRLLVRDLDRILVQNPDLYASIQTHNRYISEVHEEAINRYEEVGKLISDEDTEGLSRFIEEIDSYMTQ